MSIIKNIATTAVTAACLGAVTLTIGAGPADASGGSDDRIIKTGACSAGSDWKLKVKTDDGRLEVEGEVDSNVNGQTWAWVMKDNGTVVARGTGLTVAPSGSFEVERKITNLAGTDRVVFKATHDGESCRGAIAF
jgi:hypothetical protein